MWRASSFLRNDNVRRLKVESESQEVKISAVKVKVYKSRYPRWIFNLINFTAEPFYHLAGTICHPNSTSHKRKSSILIFHPQKNPFAICWREHQSCKTCKGGTPWKWKEFKASAKGGGGGGGVLRQMANVLNISIYLFMKVSLSRVTMQCLDFNKILHTFAVSNDSGFFESDVYWYKGKCQV